MRFVTYTQNDSLKNSLQVRLDWNGYNAGKPRTRNCYTELVDTIFIRLYIILHQSSSQSTNQISIMFYTQVNSDTLYSIEVVWGYSSNTEDVKPRTHTYMYDEPGLLPAWLDILDLDRELPVMLALSEESELPSLSSSGVLATRFSERDSSTANQSSDNPEIMSRHITLKLHGFHE